MAENFSTSDCHCQPQRPVPATVGLILVLAVFAAYRTDRHQYQPTSKGLFAGRPARSNGPALRIEWAISNACGNGWHRIFHIQYAVRHDFVRRCRVDSEKIIPVGNGP